MHALADLDVAAVGLLLAGDHAEQRRLAGAVRADHADNAARRQFEGEIVDEDFLAKALRQMLEIDDIVAEPLGDGNDDLRRLRRALVASGDEVLVALDARLGFRLTCLGGRGDPLALALERALARFLLAALLQEALLLLSEPGGII